MRLVLLIGFGMLAEAQGYAFWYGDMISKGTFIFIGVLALVADAAELAKKLLD